MFKGLFTADLHCCKKRLEGCVEVLNNIYVILKGYKKEERPYLFISGDFWETTITNTEVMAVFVNLIKDIRDITEVFMITGTITHDVPGSLDVFIAIGCHVYKSNTFEIFDNFELAAIPEPHKTKYISKCSKDKNIVEVINADLKEFANTLPQKQKTRIVMYHGEIKNLSYPTGILCNSPIALSKEYLKSLDADFIACGHIHQKQEVFENCWYLGTPFQQTYAETHIPSLFLVED